MLKSRHVFTEGRTPGVIRALSGPDWQANRAPGKDRAGAPRTVRRNNWASFEVLLDDMCALVVEACGNAAVDVVCGKWSHLENPAT